MLSKAARPLAIESRLPGVSTDGGGGARSRWKFAKFWIPIIPDKALFASMS